MKYWPSARWKTLIASGDAQQWNEPTLPFLLIGAGQISDQRHSPVAYIACCFEDSIEVWPICPIAFPRWGVVEPRHELLVGSKRICLFHESHPHWENLGHKAKTAHHLGSAIIDTVASVERQPTGTKLVPRINLAWDDKTHTVLLHRRVTIIGDDHPSILRLHGQNMSRCDHAIVAVADSVWLIDLHPKMGTAAEDLVRRLTPHGDPIAIGRVWITLGQASESPVGTTKSPNNLTHFDYGVDEPSLEVLTRATFPNTLLSSDPAAEFATQALTTQVTNRLVHVGNVRSSRRRLTVLLVFCIGIAALAWIVVRLFIPEIDHVL